MITALSTTAQTVSPTSPGRIAPPPPDWTATQVHLTAITATPTDQPTVTPTHTPTASPTLTATATVLPTDTSEQTPEIMPEITVEVTPEPTQRIVPTRTLPPPLPTTAEQQINLSGIARYQNRSGQDGIVVRVLDLQRIVLNGAPANVSGVYSLSVPAREGLWLIIDGPLHQPTAYQYRPGSIMPQIVLRGGDLNDDGCINQQDMTLLMNVFGSTSAQADINADGVVNSSDLAILGGNYDATCQPYANPITPVPQGTVETLPTVPATATVIPLSDSIVSPVDPRPPQFTPPPADHAPTMTAAP